MAILATMEITPEDFVEMYSDLDIVKLCRKHDKMDELIDYIEKTYCNDCSHWYDYKVYDDLNGYAEEIKALFGIKE